MKLNITLIIFYLKKVTVRNVGATTLRKITPDRFSYNSDFQEVLVDCFYKNNTGSITFLS